MIILSDSASAPAQKVEPFVYRTLVDEPPEPSDVVAEQAPPPPPPGIPEEEVQRREMAAREQGRREAEMALRTELQQAIQAEREAIAVAVQDFERQKIAYYRGIEQEIVQLSLAIARKILQRECDVDPLLLAGVVRVALDRLDADTTVHLRVPAGSLPQWQGFFDSQRMLTCKPVLVADASLTPGQCRLETELGATDLGIDLQMQEVEQAFASLLARRSGADA
jgi:flagellar assembly protein FliH